MQQPSRAPLREQHAGHWREILIGLGVPAKALVNRHGPCPICGGRDRFRFDDKGGHGTFICSQCGAGDGPKLAMLFTGLSFRALAEKLDGNGPEDAGEGRRLSSDPQPAETPSAKRGRMNALWCAAHPVSARDPAGIYLGRRLGLVPYVMSLRYVAECAYPHGGSYPAMLAMFIAADGTPSGLHRTYLTPTGEKAPVVSPKMSGRAR